MKKTFRFAAAAVALALSGVSAGALAQINPAYTMQQVGQLSDSRPFTLGFDFSLSSAVTLNALGYTTVGFTSNQQVGLWDSGGNLLLSTTVTTSDMQDGFFRWASVTPFNLGPGVYTIGGTYNGGPFAANASGVSYAPGYTWLSDRQLFGAGLNRPTSTTGGYGEQGIPQVNLSFVNAAVPEPTTWAMLILGFGAVGATMRRRQQITRVRFA